VTCVRCAGQGELGEGAVRHVHVAICNPDEFSANRQALSLVDWIRAEFPGLDVTTDAHEWSDTDIDGRNAS
jgi:hypothetical protein